MSCGHEFWRGDGQTWPCSFKANERHGDRWHTHSGEGWYVTWFTGSEFDHVDQVEDDPPMQPVTTRHGVTT